MYFQEANRNKEKYKFADKMVRKYLERDLYPTQKPIDEQKRILNRYIKRIDLYADHAEVEFIVDIDGCGTRI